MPQPGEGPRPLPRYGHAVCGIAGDRLLLYGGMLSGGYAGEVNDVWVLRLLDEVCSLGWVGTVNEGGGGLELVVV